jgi:type VI secretion system protein VasG
VINEIQASVADRPFIDEAHTLIGAGGSAGAGDAANLLKPALARGELRTIAATTWAEYKKYFEKDAALARRFQVVKIEEPDEDKDDDDAGHRPLCREQGGTDRPCGIGAPSHRYTRRQLPDKSSACCGLRQVAIGYHQPCRGGGGQPAHRPDRAGGKDSG